MATLLAGNEALQQRRQRMTPQARISSLFDSSRSQGEPRPLIPPSPGFRLSQVALPSQAAPQAQDAISAAFARLQAGMQGPQAPANVPALVAGLQARQAAGAPQAQVPPGASAEIMQRQMFQEPRAYNTPWGTTPAPGNLDGSPTPATPDQLRIMQSNILVPGGVSTTYVPGWNRVRSVTPEGAVMDRWENPNAPRVYDPAVLMQAWGL